ncbi:hypothetical protein KZH41_22615 [Pseudomonas sp. YeP6b]|uniref:hypothetical protein n=1 Tax=Pseudomonas sp. YeP6b TaxID=2861775 RepID=UPI0021D9D0EB|nr:hypothetical protein [Pseudomonas sp. YeP6b]UXZ21258.1 hypothetical protein KZH41_22615 [Pseudomonas sp. YeP6b]
MIDSLLLRVLPEQVPTRDENVYVDTVFELYRLASNQVPSAEQDQLLAFLSMRVEIAGRLFCAYGPEGKKIADDPVETQWSEVALGVFFCDFLRLSEMSGHESVAFKRLNAIFKLVDSIHSIGSKREVFTDLREAIDIQSALFLNRYSVGVASESARLTFPSAVASEQKVLPITVLFWEGPIARAYLAAIKSMGYRPERIIHLISALDLVSKKPVGRYLPSFLRDGYAQGVQKNSIHYWASELLKKEPELCVAIRSSVAQSLFFDSEVLENALALSDLRGYCPNVETLMINDLADDRLYNYLAVLPETNLLFTGGGIVPARSLQLAHLKFIHVHPGYLPDVRGADGVLWSQLIKGRTSASCFYMAPGIDDGDVIFPCYLPTVKIIYDPSTVHLKMLYRALYAFFDPWVRAYALREAISATEGLNFKKVFEQDESLSTTYHFMHEKLQKVSLSEFFID